MAATRSTGFFGRTRERGLLDRLLADVRDGQSAVLVIRGEAGVGKTALLRHAAEQADGFRLMQLAGVESEMELAYAGLHQLCAPMLDRLGPLPKPQRSALSVAFGLAPGDPPDRFLVAIATLSLLSAFAEDQPLLCLVDDVQWLDETSAQVLGFVARRLLAEPVAIVFAAREPCFRRELEAFPELRLDGLGEEDARALLDTVIQGRLDEPVRDRIIAETRGNPLALLELPRGMSAAELAGGFVLPDAGDLARHIEDRYARRVDGLDHETRRLMLLAAADPIGDATLLWRAAQSSGIGQAAAEPAIREQLIEISGRVRFRHPLVRSAVYRAARPADRQAAHTALAAATDAQVDPDRRAWHRAHAADPPDEGIAEELVDSAGRAECRGGIAAAAAFHERAVAFTPEPALRSSRALTAAQSKHEAGDFAATEALLATAVAGPLPERGLAEVELLRAQMAFDLRRGRDAPPLLLHAARRLDAIDGELGREAHLEALVAAVYAGRLAAGDDTARVALAARSAPLPDEPLTACQLLVLGLAIRLTDGYVAAAPTLTRAVHAYLDEERKLDRHCLAYTLAAMELWDDEAWLELASSQVELVRETGALLLLPHALDHLAGVSTQAGDLSTVAALLAEAEGLDLGVRTEFPLRLAAWHGETSVALRLADEMTRGARARGEGSAIASGEYDLAVLYNGLGQYEPALDAAVRATATDDLVTSSWALFELVEAAARSGHRAQAREGAEHLAERTRASGTAWARGAGARSHALVEDGDAAEALHREALEWLDQSRMAWYLARARLSYGEWLRRENRRRDAREQLRAAYDMFRSMGTRGFLERARRELMASGETVRRRDAETRDQLTAQELQIARFAADGLSNPEIGARLFLSPRTVEWHLRKVFAKLGLHARQELRAALRDTRSELVRP